MKRKAIYEEQEVEVLNIDSQNYAAIVFQDGRVTDIPCYKLKFLPYTESDTRLTKREQIAAIAMQGIFSNNNLLLATMQGTGTYDPCKAAAYIAKESANELINQLKQ